MMEANDLCKKQCQRKVKMRHTVRCFFSAQEAILFNLVRRFLVLQCNAGTVISDCSKVISENTSALSSQDEKKKKTQLDNESESLTRAREKIAKFPRKNKKRKLQANTLIYGTLWTYHMTALTSGLTNFLSGDCTLYHFINSRGRLYETAHSCLTVLVFCGGIMEEIPNQCTWNGCLCLYI